MTPDLVVLGRRAVACRVWEWRPGMQINTFDANLPSWRIVQRDRTGKPAWLAYAPSGVDYLLTDTEMAADWLPDLSDAATLGCLLALVREAWQPREEFRSWMSVGWSSSSNQHEVFSGRFGVTFATGKTEAEALVAALEMVGRATGGGRRLRSTG